MINCADTLSDVVSAILSLPTLAHALSNADESPAIKQTRHATMPYPSIQKHQEMAPGRSEIDIQQ